MAQVERYVRLSVVDQPYPGSNTEYILGLAFEPEENTLELRQALRELVQDAVSAAMSDENWVYFFLPEPVFVGEWDGQGDRKIAEAIHVLVADRWPGRAHFIEVQHDSDDGWVQIFQPYDLPVRPELVPIPQPPPPTKPGYQFPRWMGAPVA